MSIRLRILIACLSLTAVTIGFGVVARLSQGELGRLAFRLYDEAFMSMSYLRSAQNTVLAISREMASADVARQTLDDKLDSVLSDLQVARDRALSPQGGRAASSLQQQISTLRQQVAEGRHVDDALLSDIESRFDDAVEINAGDGFRYRRKTETLVAAVEQQTWVVTGVSVLVALVITVLLSRSIVPSVRYAVGIATRIAAGRLDNPIRTRGSGETAVLLTALASMQTSISDKMTRINDLMAQQASTHATEIAAHHLRFETALDNMMQGLCMLDEHRGMVVHNRRFAEMFAAVDVGEMLDSVLPAALLLSGAEDDQNVSSYTRTLDDARTIAVSERPMESGGWVVTYEDVSERHRSEARLAHLARHDALTGLPNRLLFRERMEVALTDDRKAGGIAVLCLDLDQFKAVSDTLGRSTGDKLLCAVAERLLRYTSEADTVVRLDGDEFGIIQSAQTQPQAAKDLAERILTIIAEPFDIEENRICIGTSIGIAIHGSDVADADGLLKNADLALYRAKTDGRGAYRFFEAAMDAMMQARRRLETDLRSAIEANQLTVYYQPLVTTSTRRISGFEALVRWIHPVRGMISPAEFIPVAEETGLINPLGTLVLEHACRDARSWPDHVKVAVNLSPLQFRNRQLATDVETILRRSGLSATRLELEVTESVLLDDVDAILAILHDIRALGVQISMDDLGTGYSSLSYLRRFPFDKIKIDQSFVRNLRDSDDCLAIIRAVLGMGKSLNMRVVAEGVETEEQCALLDREGCGQVQGYLFSRPQPLEQVLALLANDSQAIAA